MSKWPWPDRLKATTRFSPPALAASASSIATLDRVRRLWRGDDALGPQERQRRWKVSRCFTARASNVAAINQGADPGHAVIAQPPAWMPGQDERVTAECILTTGSHLRRVAVIKVTPFGQAGRSGWSAAMTRALALGQDSVDKRNANPAKLEPPRCSRRSRQGYSSAIPNCNRVLPMTV